MSGAINSAKSVARPKSSGAGCKRANPSTESRGVRVHAHATALLSAISANLRLMRRRRGYSLERLAKVAGVSRAMLSQIETGKSVPTISLLLKIADGLGVPVASLLVAQSSRAPVVLPRAQAKIATARDGRFTWRALFPLDSVRRSELYELSIAAGHREAVQRLAAGTNETIVAVEGTVEFTAGGEPPILLSPGDAVQFYADVPHSYRNTGANRAVLHALVIYVEPVGPSHPHPFAVE